MAPIITWNIIRLRSISNLYKKLTWSALLRLDARRMIKPTIWLFRSYCSSSDHLKSLNYVTTIKKILNMRKEVQDFIIKNIAIIILKFNVQLDRIHLNKLVSRDNRWCCTKTHPFSRLYNNCFRGRKCWKIIWNQSLYEALQNGNFAQKKAA